MLDTPFDIVEIHWKPSMPTAENDFERISRIAAGDENALRSLYAAYGQRMYAYALRLTGDAIIAEEVVQDSLVAVWQGAARFRREGRVIAWLLGIVHHKAMDAFKAARRSQNLAELEEVELALPDRAEPGPDEQIVLGEQSRLLREALQHLSLEHRTVLELVFYQGLNLNETAQVCGCPLGTVKSRLNYAKSSLRGFLSRQGINPEDIV